MPKLKFMCLFFNFGGKEGILSAYHMHIVRLLMNIVNHAIQLVTADVDQRYQMTMISPANEMLNIIIAFLHSSMQCYGPFL